MNDLWADVRTTGIPYEKNHNAWCNVNTYTTGKCDCDKGKLRRLLADADALLAAVRAGIAYEAENPCDRDIFPEQRVAWQEYQKALAALPEHLKCAPGDAKP